jgi:hypothetical protein
VFQLRQNEESLMSEESPYEKQLRKFLIPILRRKSLYWPGRQEAKRLSRVERGFYKCHACKKLFGPKEIELDHIRPVINVKTSWTNWDDFIRSLYCDSSNFQVLCKADHLHKTQIEDALRSINKKKSRKKKKA